MDNRGAQDLIRTSLVPKRSKHIDIRYHYVRDIASRGIIKPTSIGTKEMAADGFTKPLPGGRKDPQSNIVLKSVVIPNIVSHPTKKV